MRIPAKVASMVSLLLALSAPAALATATVTAGGSDPTTWAAMATKGATAETGATIANDAGTISCASGVAGALTVTGVGTTEALAFSSCTLMGSSCTVAVDSADLPRGFGVDWTSDTRVRVRLGNTSTVSSPLTPATPKKAGPTISIGCMGGLLTCTYSLPDQAPAHGTDDTAGGVTPTGSTDAEGTVDFTASTEVHLTLGAGSHPSCTNGVWSGVYSLTATPGGAITISV
jgi:hypothetical protein